MHGMVRKMSVEEAIAAFSRIGPVRPRRMSLSEASGLRTAEDIVVKRPVPVMAQAARDGWAVTAASTAGATRRTPMLLGGPAVQVDAGAPLPAGADAVLPIEDAVSRQRGPSAIRPVAAGAGVVPVASVAAAGSVLVPVGTRITFAVAMACAHCGITDVMVRRPVVDIIFNSSGFTRSRDQWIGVIGSAIRGSGSEIGAIQFTACDQVLLTEALLASSADIITVVGGTGTGPGDTTMQSIAAAGELIVHGLRLSPGSTFGFGMVGSKPVFASPGGLADMIAVNIVLSWPFARQAFGRPPLTPPLLRAPLASGLRAASDGSRLVFARYAQGVVTPFDDAAFTPAMLAQANASIFLAEGSRHRRRGETVSFFRLGVTM
jgi:molybdopterin molybdotransferase